MKLKTKINFYSTILFICLLVIINGAIYFSFSHLMFKNELEKSELETNSIVNGIIQAPLSVSGEELLPAYVPINGMVRIVKADGTFITGITAPDQEHLIDSPLSYQGMERQEIVTYGDVPMAFVSIPIIWGTSGEVAELQLTQNLASTAQILEVLKFVLIVATILAAIPALLSSRFLGNFITRPITKMINTMDEIQTSGHYKQIDLPKQTNDELYQMGKTFNRMIISLKQNYEKQEEFVSNASHELKTPLTVIESYASLLKRRGKEQIEVFDESVEAIHSEAIRMKELTQQLLTLAKHEEKWNVEITVVHLDQIMTESIKSFQTAFNRDIILNTEASISVKADLQKLKQLIYIFLDNAIKYSEDHINVNIRSEINYGVIEIIDHGIGIPADELPNIFDRFYRVDKARSRKAGGFGLGLSLAKEIADAMDAKILMDSREGEGTKVQILLNLA